MSNNTDNSSQSPNDDKIEKAKREKEEKEKEESEDRINKSYKGNQDLKNKMFLGCFGLAGIMLSAAAISSRYQLCGFAKFEWWVYAEKTIMVMLFVFGLHAIAVALSIEALSKAPQFLWKFIPRKEDKSVTSRSYDWLIGIAKTLDAFCLFTISGWCIYVAWRIWEKSPLF